MKRLRPHLLVFCLLLLLGLTGQQQRLRDVVQDTRFALQQRPASGEIVLVEIDPHSIARFGAWPWPRTLHAELIGALDKAGVTDIAFDVDFSSPSTPAADQALASALRAGGGSVILAAFRQRMADRGNGKVVHDNRPLPAFAEAAWLGLVNVHPDRDGIIRRYSHGETIDGTFVPSLGALLAGRHAADTAPFAIDFGIAAGSIPSVSFADVLAGKAETLATVRGRKVIVSGTAIELGDRFNVPNGRIIPGSVVQALAAESILQDRVLRTTSWPFALGSVLVVALAMFAAWGRLRAPWRAGLVLLIAAAAEVAAFRLQLAQPIAADTSPLLIVAVLYALVIGIDEIDLRGALRSVAERRFQRVAMSLVDGLVCTDERGRITMWNAGATAVFGHEAQEMIGQPFALLFAGGAQAPDDSFAALVRQWQEQLGQEEPGQDHGGAGIGAPLLELSGRRKSGETFDLECSLSTWDTTDGVQFGAILRDISPRKRQQERMRYLAENDTLTDLPNRNSLIARLGRAMAPQDAATGQGHSALILISIERFEQINNLHGHSFGDRLVMAVAARLRSMVAPGACIARLSDDEFAILAPGLDNGAALAFGRAVIADFRRDPVPVLGSQHRISMSVGYALSGDARGAEDFLGNAHFALAAAKAEASAAPVPFDPAMRDALAARNRLEAELRLAFSSGEFELFYQPQVEITSGAIVGAEALIRWKHPVRGHVSPGEFMPVVNTTSLSEDIARFVLESACRQAAAWEARGWPIRVGINLAQSQFASGGLTSQVVRVLQANNLTPGLLELEVTEDIILDNVQEVQDTLAAIQDLGVRIAFDDFGTGYGSLTYLKAFPLQTLKIDRSFVMGIISDDDDRAIVASTINLARAMGLSVIAEGIEDQVTADLLLTMGCDEAQGYHFGKPMPAALFEAHLRESLSARQQRRA